MIRIALKSLAARRLRTALTALAVVLGVAMVSGAFTLTDTMRGAADSLSRAAYDGTDAVVAAPHRVRGRRRRLDRQAARPSTAACSSGCARMPGVASPPPTSPTRRRSSSGDGKPAGDGPYFGVGFDAAHAGLGAAHAVPARDRPLGDRAGRGRDRRRHGRGPGLPRRRHGADRDARRAARVRGRRHRAVRERQVARRRDGRGVRPRASRRSCSTAATASTGSSSPAATASGRRTAARRAGRRAAAGPGRDRRRSRTASRSTGSSSSSRSSGSRCWCSAAWRSWSARSRSSTRSRSRSPSARASSGCCGWSAPGGARCSAPCWSRRSPSASLASVAGLLAGLGLAKALDAFFDAIGLALPDAGTVFATRTIVVSLLLGTGVTADRRAPAGVARDARARRWRRCARAEPGGGRLRLPARAVRGWPRSSGGPRRRSAARPARSRGATRCASPGAP